MSPSSLPLSLPPLRGQLGRTAAVAAAKRKVLKLLCQIEGETDRPTVEELCELAEAEHLRLRTDVATFLIENETNSENLMETVKLTAAKKGV